MSNQEEKDRQNTEGYRAGRKSNIVVDFFADLLLPDGTYKRSRDQGAYDRQKYGRELRSENADHTDKEVSSKGRSTKLTSRSDSFLAYTSLSLPVLSFFSFVASGLMLKANNNELTPTILILGLLGIPGFLIVSIILLVILLILAVFEIDPDIPRWMM